MAQMIPPIIPLDTPLGERQLFERLRDDPGTHDWVVLHSLDVKKHEKKIESEIDMLVLVPGWGVLCVEVKGSNVTRKNGIWDYGYEQTPESPFKQASSAMHALRKYVVSRNTEFSSLLFFSAVFFTRIEFDEKSPEWHPWQYVSKSRFNSVSVSQLIVDILGRAHHHIEQIIKARWYSSEGSRPSSSQIIVLTKLLRDQFDYKVSRVDEIRDAEKRIAKFTEEQYESMEALRGNPRVVIKGPAGTGKTYLAMETVRRAIDDGKKVIFICFNRHLGEWLRNNFSENINENFFCGTLHRLMLDIAEEARDLDNVSPLFWSQDLPELALNRLLESPELSRSYDLLVIDEAQDILEDSYLAVLDLLLSGGLRDGNWCFFGDYEKQAIYREHGNSISEQDLFHVLESYSPGFVNFSLRNNCRNAKPISDLLTLTCDLKPGYRRVIHHLDIADAITDFYESSEQQADKLKLLIERELQHFTNNEIVVLSPRNPKDSCAGGCDIKSNRFRLVDYRLDNLAKGIRFSSIHAFKGLEAAVIIVTDVEGLGTEKMKSLLYVGMSRAKVRLYLLMHDLCRDDWNDMLDRGLLG
jgi:hypothetical protein